MNEIITKVFVEQPGYTRSVNYGSFCPSQNFHSHSQRAKRRSCWTRRSCGRIREATTSESDSVASGQNKSFLQDLAGPIRHLPVSGNTQLVLGEIISVSLRDFLGTGRKPLGSRWLSQTGLV